MTQSLWNFSCALYAHPGVAEQCLQLQDKDDADVCLLLAALWLESRGVAPTAARVERLRQLAQPWREAVVVPLRQLRRDWKAAAATDADLAALRGRLAELELQAERLLLERIEALAADWPAEDAHDAAADGRAGWLEALGTSCGLARQRLREAAGLAIQS